MSVQVAPGVPRFGAHPSARSELARMLVEDRPPPALADASVNYAMLPILYHWCAEVLLAGQTLRAPEVSRVMSRTMWLCQTFLGSFPCLRNDLQLLGAAATTVALKVETEGVALEQARGRTRARCRSAACCLMPRLPRCCPPRRAGWSGSPECTPPRA